MKTIQEKRERKSKEKNYPESTAEFGSEEMMEESSGGFSGEYSSGETDALDTTNGSDVVDLTGVKKTVLRTKLALVVILVVTCIATSVFTHRGVTAVKKDTDEQFVSRAQDLTAAIEASFNDYETAALLTHDRCRRDQNTTREEFYEFNKYLLASGMEFQSVQCSPNVTLEDRPKYENESFAFYSEYYPEANYRGFKGLVPDPENIGFKGSNNGGLVVGPSPPLPVYFPVYYAEPVMPNAGALGFDMYSVPTQKNEIDLAVATREVVLSKRLQLVTEVGADDAYSIIIYHPGIYLETSPDVFPKDLGLIVVRILSLLTRVAKVQEENFAVYLYDTTVFNTGGEAEFLSAMSYSTDHNSQEFQIGFKEIEEVDIATVRKMNSDSSRRYEQDMDIASGSWKVLVTPVDSTYDSNYSFVIFGGAMILLAGLGLCIFLYINTNRLLQIYTAKAEAEAEKNILSSLFPKNIRDRLVTDAKAKNAAKRQKAGFQHNPSSPFHFSSELSSESIFGSKAIADFHPRVTIFCADLAGFTAWSSVREPSQVLTLLEVVYNAFDKLAQKRNVLKVETVGDTYVAACGLPNEREDHAVVIARYAVECLSTFQTVIRELETTLGPDTGDLDIRIGIHSGAVTAGMLRGDKGRFQLFGDTFKLSLHMQSTGRVSKIHISSDTAELLAHAGKSNWLTARDDQISMQGRGHVKTFWLNTGGERTRSVTSITSGGTTISAKKLKKEKKDRSRKIKRLVKWNVAELSKLLKNVLAARESKKLDSVKWEASPEGLLSESNLFLHNDDIPLDSVKDVVYLPELDMLNVGADADADAADVELPDEVIAQLTEFVRCISQLYRRNPFHNFEHASHVSMSVTKLLARISSKKTIAFDQNNDGKIAQLLAEATFGITSDPMTAFTAFVAALIHDVDHQGIPNTVLATQDVAMNKHYKGTSLAEQHSLDLSWKLLMSSQFAELRSCIFSNEKELIHFRQLLVNMVMATDVMDKNLATQRKGRWNKAFDADKAESLSEIEDKNRKATIVIEHLIQASDVSHTMQHWHVYIKWNERLFMELFHAYQQGHTDNDPCEGWYQGEIGFLTFYVLPLASKLDTCGVFGVSSDEFRLYANENLKEWKLKGEALVGEYVKKYWSCSLSTGIKMRKDGEAFDIIV